MKRFLLAAALVLTPGLALAQGTGLEGILAIISNLVNIAAGLVVGLAILFFFWGLAMYILNSGDEEAKGKGRNIMIWGIIALFVMVSVWGLVRVLSSTFNLQNTPIDVPTIIQ